MSGSQAKNGPAEGGCAHLFLNPSPPLAKKVRVIFQVISETRHKSASPVQISDIVERVCPSLKISRNELKVLVGLLAREGYLHISPRGGIFVSAENGFRLSLPTTQPEAVQL